MVFDRERLRDSLAALAARGVFVGTSSWKYPGWLGQVYTRDRYVFRGRFSEARFNRDCLSEYAQVFPTVCVDAAYYKFPDRRSLEGTASAVPEGFRFGFKVTDEITLKRFTRLPRFGERAGRANENFLNAGLFTDRFVAPFEAVRERVGVFILEFSRFYPSDFARGREFVEALDGFLGRIPKGWPYAIELRNPTFLQPAYFEVLGRHAVAHVFNSWEAMPSVAEQMVLGGTESTPLLAARFLLRPGRRYEQAVSAFSPYSEIRDVYPAGRSAGAGLIRRGLEAGPAKRAFVFVNNRFEGNAPLTIRAMVEEGTKDADPPVEPAA